MRSKARLGCAKNVESVYRDLVVCIVAYTVKPRFDPGLSWWWPHLMNISWEWPTPIADVDANMKLLRNWWVPEPIKTVRRGSWIWALIASWTVLCFTFQQRVVRTLWEFRTDVEVVSCEIHKSVRIGRVPTSLTFVVLVMRSLPRRISPSG